MPIAKESATFAVWSPEGTIEAPTEGVFRRDTRYLSGWRWRIPGSMVLMSEEVESGLHQRLAITNPQRVQDVGVERRVELGQTGFQERLVISNTSQGLQDVQFDLLVEAQFGDVMSRWISDGPDVKPETIALEGGAWQLSRTAADGQVNSARISTSSLLSSQDGHVWSGRAQLEPGKTLELVVDVKFDELDPEMPALPTYAEWSEGFPGSEEPLRRTAYRRAVEDLRLLLLPTRHGPYPAAGLPWFVTEFGRDALLTAHMLLDDQPSLALSVLRNAVDLQGVTLNSFNEEAPGKIFHEIRRGELSRIKRIPFGRYYGSIDATPLFLILLDAYVTRTGETERITEFLPAWRAAYAFIVDHQSAQGLLAFEPSGSGLSVQSWKDSPDSMNHADGSPAEAPLAVAEVQGYAIEAFQAVARFYAVLGDREASEAAAERSARLTSAFEAAFWLEDLGTYAMALDRYGRPLQVLSSDAGHLLWAGAVPPTRAKKVVSAMMGEDLWSGWGLRTLGAREKRYNPVSYHNGSVWPHDTAIFAGGLARYGFRDELAVVRDALFDLAANQPLYRMPELISGHARRQGEGPIPYTHACKPQAWAAASLPYLESLMRTSTP